MKYIALTMLTLATLFVSHVAEAAAVDYGEVIAWAKANPEQAATVMAALDDAEAWSAANPEQAAALLGAAEQAVTSAQSWAAENPEQAEQLKKTVTHLAEEAQSWAKEHPEQVAATQAAAKQVAAEAREVAEAGTPPEGEAAQQPETIMRPARGQAGQWPTAGARSRPGGLRR